MSGGGDESCGGADGGGERVGWAARLSGSNVYAAEPSTVATNGMRMAEGWPGMEMYAAPCSYISLLVQLFPVSLSRLLFLLVFLLISAIWFSSPLFLFICFCGSAIK